MPRPRSAGLTITVLALAGLVVAVMQTLMVPLIPELPRLVGVSAEDASWLITATLLASAVATPSLSRLADMYGKRLMMVVSLGFMTAGSLLGVFGESLGLLIVARVLQGCSIALIPIAMSIMRDELPRERLGSAVALVSATLGIGAAVGLPLSGFIYLHFGFHALFWVSTVAGALMIGAVLATIPESRLRSGGAFDLLGAVLLSGALVSLLLAITKGGHWGWISEPTLAAFSLAAILFLAWLPWELRARRPLVDLRTTARRPVLLTNISSFLIGFAMYCNMLTTTEVLQMPTATGYGFGLTAMQAGLAMLPAALMMVLLAPVSATITRRFGASITLIAGAATLAAGYLLRIFLMTSEWQIIIGAMVVSAGTAIAYAAMPVLIMRSVPATETAAANGVNTVLRSIGTSTASAAVAAVLTTFTLSVAGVDLPDRVAFQTVWVLAAVAAVLGGLVAIAIPRRRTPPAESPDQLRPEESIEEVVARGRVVGTAFDTAPHPAAHATVNVTSLSGRALDWNRADASGEFAVALPRWGTYVVTASAPGWASRAVVVAFESAEKRPEVVLTERRLLTGHVLAPSGLAAEASILLLDADGAPAGHAETGPEGRFQLPLPAPGQYVLTVVSADGDATAQDLIIGQESLDVTVPFGVRAAR